ncbi:HEAT repeat domain-containing protein [Phormidium sp. LEGE 05292]|uniref:HEAT repeat domain-containing protein n=1 Tax=[Phormidium] sp. LEGE 05292 TaxID=767427 RepID=UPI00187DF106|nr:HEAT repeat domain-containing protein [Phormidium sp. LEGE 05292]MBE9225179.1 HEAT repeat domain-containing protein [Phormidium sp. LEGE 05292]
MDNNTRKKLILAPKIAFICLSVILPLIGSVKAQTAINTEIITKVEKLRDTDKIKRLETVRELRKIGVTAIPVLTAALQEKEQQIRGGAAFALGAIGPEAKTAIPQLIVMLKDEDEQVRLDAAVALRRIGSPAVYALTKALKDDNVLVRRGATFALAGIGAQAKQTIPILIEMLSDNDEQIRLNASIALRGIGATATPALTEALQHKNPLIRKGAAIALGQIHTEISQVRNNQNQRDNLRPNPCITRPNLCAPRPNICEQRPNLSAPRPNICAPRPSAIPTPIPRQTPQPKT